MQYSPMNDIPYISRVDAGTIELVRAFRVERSAARNSCNDSRPCSRRSSTKMHVEASDKMHRIIQEAFAEIAAPNSHR